MNHEPIDLRSDAITRPTEAMWEAMQRATPGWAAANDDRHVHELEQYAAELLGKEAALFVPTGSMANLIALMASVERGEQVIFEQSSHIFWSVQEWALGSICGANPLSLPSDDGCPDPEAVRSAIVGHRFSHTALVCLENSHNVAGGTAISTARIAQVADIAHTHGSAVHLDGARLFNAAVALGEHPAKLAAPADSVAISLSKGLSAPYGALLLGSAAWISRARIALKRLGGHSIPNAGILASAALIALRDMPARLSQDHQHARSLAHGLKDIPGLELNLQSVQTNIILVRTTTLSAAALLTRLAERGVLAANFNTDVIRFVTHRHIGAEEVARTIAAVRLIFQELLG